MPKAYRISRNPTHPLYFLVDTCFLVNKYLKPSTLKDVHEQRRVQQCHAWWREIDLLIDQDRAKIYVPDLCIAEAFKVLAKKNYQTKAFKYAADYKAVKERLRRDIHLPLSEARKANRRIRFHDIPTSRDVIISIDRFFEPMFKLKLQRVSGVDLIVLATAKYLIDFFGFTRDDLFLVTVDSDLYRLARSLRDVPIAFNPLIPKDAPEKVFRLV